MTRFVDNPQEREIVDDPLFGKLSYHKRLVNHTDFDGKAHLCRLPFTYAEIRNNGDVHMCCPNWSPVVVGNVLQNSLAEIWRGARAEAVRNSIMDGSYRYCNWDTCNLIRNGLLMARNEQAVYQLQAKAQLETPESVHFVVDESCNLACPSCRIGRISQLEPRRKERGYRVIAQVLDCMFSQPHDQHKVISMDGSGEIFSSDLYRKLFETHAVFTDTDRWPNLRFRLTTNGTMMTPKLQRRYHSIMQQLEELEVSVDAGNRESYERVRVGGHWDLLWENLRYFHDTTLRNRPDMHWRWNIIMQKNNYESLPQMIDIAKTFERRPSLNITEALNWGTWTEEQYLEHAVHLPQHPEYPRYYQIRNSDQVTQYMQANKI